MHEVNEGDFLVRRVVASVFLIFFGFAVAACGNEEAEGAVSGDYAKTGSLSTDDFPVDNQAPEGAKADGRVLKPEGHKGVWFETEPENPWEHYVWESQKFVGDPLELPKLKGQRPNDPLEGLPDVCDEKVVERMKEVGFEQRKGMRFSGFSRCSFSDINFNKYSVGPTYISLTYDTNIDQRMRKVEDDILNPEDDPLLIEWADSNEADCRYGVEESGVLVGYTTFHSADDDYNGKHQCRAVKLIRQIFINIA